MKVVIGYIVIYIYQILFIVYCSSSTFLYYSIIIRYMYINMHSYNIININIYIYIASNYVICISIYV